MIDVCAWIGGYPFRELPHPDPDVLVRVLQREGYRGAWVGYLPAAWHRDPTPANDALFKALAPHREVLRPVPVVRPDWPRWDRTLTDAVTHGAHVIRAYPPQWGMAPGSAPMRDLANACGDRGVVLQLVVRFEDLRQRHWMDAAGDLAPAAVRDVVRANPRVHVVVSGAGHEFVQEVHWGLTAGEQSRCFWDISWIWGPPEDHLAMLLRTIGAERFTTGTMWPLRLTQAPRANLDLLPDDLRTVSLADGDAILASAREASSG